MRSVHEIDSIRNFEGFKADHEKIVSDLTNNPPRPPTPPSKLQRIRLKLSNPHKDGEPDHPDKYVNMDAAPPPGLSLEGYENGMLAELGPEHGLDEHELSLPLPQLYRVLRRQIFWAEQELETLRAEWEDIEPKRERAWHEKEAVFDDLIEAQLRLMQAFVGPAEPDLNGLGPASSVEKLEQQQMQFSRQQEKLRAKSVEQQEGDDTAV